MATATATAALTGLPRALTPPAGEAHYQAVFHKQRSLCCARVADASSCAFSLHEPNGTTLADTARAALAAGQTCLTYEFLMEYSTIQRSLEQLAAGGASARLPSHLVTSAALHTMKHHNVSYYRSEVDAFLSTLASPAWRATPVALHGCASPNFTAIAAGGFPQREEVVRSFNAALRDALAAAAAPLPRLVHYYGVTGEAAARHRFPYLDAVHFADPFYFIDRVCGGCAGAARRRLQQNSGRK
jgi:hypothetical protein